jgi:hypothetical protein
MKKLDAISAFVFMSAVRLILVGNFIFFSGFTIYLLFSGYLEERILGFNMETESVVGVFAILVFLLFMGIVIMSGVFKQIRGEYRSLKNSYIWEK